MRESFINHVFKNYQAYCVKKSLRPSTTNFLEYLLECKLIKSSEIYHYVILYEYADLMKQKKHKNKTQTIKAIAHTFNLHENRIWNLIKDHRGKYEIESLRFPKDKKI